MGGRAGSANASRYHPALRAPEDDDEGAEGDERQHAAELQCTRDDWRVATRRGIPVVAEEQQTIDDRADAARRRLDEREAHVARRVVDAGEVAREPAVGRDDRDDG